MADYRRILRLLLQGRSYREIAAAVGCSHRDVATARRVSREEGITAERLAGMPEAELMVLFPDGRSRVSYVTVAGLGLVNTHLGVILADVALALPVFIFLMVSFFVNLPRELHDAARVDGARELRIFWSVILPLSKPAVVTVALLEFLWSWNDLLLRLVFLTRDPLRTMTVGLLFYQGQQTRNVAGITAAAVIMGVPIIILFLIFQRQFVQGLTKGAVK